MDLKKAFLLLYFLFLLHLPHRFTHAISPSSTPLASVDPIPFQEVDSKMDGDANLAVVVKKGSGGGGGRSFGGGGRGFGGGRSGDRGTSGRGGRIRPIPIYGGGSHHNGHRSSGGREIASGWLSLSVLAGLVLVF